MAKVLLADDDPLVVGLAAESLRRAGHVVVGCTTADGLARAFRQEDPDVVLQGLPMAGVDVETFLFEIEDASHPRARLTVFTESLRLDELASRFAREGDLLEALVRGGSVGAREHWPVVTPGGRPRRPEPGTASVGTA